MIVNRREFLKLAVAASAAGVIVPAFAAPRHPYVNAGDSVSFCGLQCGPGAASFIGGTIVHEVHEWDGIGYPCTLYDQGFRNPPEMMPFRIYDTDLYAPVKRGELRGKMYDDFSEAYSARPGRYKNMASWIREQRLGESPEHYELRRIYMPVA